MSSNKIPGTEAFGGMLETMAAWQESFMEETFTNMRRFSALPFIPQKIDKIQKGVTPREMVYDEDRLKLYSYTDPTKVKYKTPICFVFALVNRPYIVDLKENRSVIAHFV